MQTKPETIESDNSAIRKVADEFLAAYNASNLEKVCALLTDGAVLMPPNEPAITGIDLVRDRIESFFSGFTFTMRFDPQQTDLTGDIAFERGAYTAFALLKGANSAPRGGYGDYLLLFEREPGGPWKIAAFGTAAAQGLPPGNVAAPDRLENAVEGSSDLKPAYWRDKWLETLSEHRPYVVPGHMRERLGK